MQTGRVGTQADLARHLGVTPQAVSKAIANGRIAKRSDGTIDFAEAARTFTATRPPSAVEPASPVALDLTAPVADEPSEQTRDYQKSRAEREFYQAELARLELERQQGLLLRADDVTEAMGEAAMVIRSKLDSLFGRAEALDAAARNGGVEGVRALLKEAIRDVQQSISASLRDLGNGDD